MEFAAIRESWLNWTVFGWGAGLFVVGLAASALLMGVVFVRLPDDYFCELRKESDRGTRSAGSLLPGIILKNLVGILLVVIGVILCFLPGQGLLTVLVGVLLCDFPGKRQLERKLVSYPGILPAMNALRQRFGRKPLIT